MHPKDHWSSAKSPAPATLELSSTPLNPVQDEPFCGETVTVLLGSLPRYQADMILRFILEEEIISIAERYRLGRKTVSRHIHRGLAALRDHPAASLAS